MALRGEPARRPGFRPDPQRLAPTPADSRLCLTRDFEPRGDQPAAIRELLAGLERGDQYQVLLGVPVARRPLQRLAATRAVPEYPRLTRVPAPPNDPLRH